ncbi:hypothetical protein BDV3_002488 [Batrachochytrium dendrobatidis]
MDTLVDANSLEQTKKHRVFIHLDLDAFYAQVEQVRLGLPPTVPLAVQQWNGMIAINYAAREMGIHRFGSIKDAKRTCPELLLVHVATYADGDTEPKYHPNPSQKTHKVSLDVYRQASNKIMDILSKCGSPVKQASIDEAYVDITDYVNKLIESGDWKNIMSESHSECKDLQDEQQVHSDMGPMVRWNKDTCSAMGDLVTSYGIFDLQLYLGSRLSASLRKQIFDELGYTCSTGIAHGKILAKLVSSINKPNKQTVLQIEKVPDFMKTIKLSKINGMGGKFGAEIMKTFQVTMAHELWVYSADELVKQLGYEHGTWLYNACRGIDFQKIQGQTKSQSMTACKNLTPNIHSTDDARYWLGILASELYTRVNTEFETNQRWPKLLVLHFRNPNCPADKSKSCPFPNQAQLTGSDVIFQKAWVMLESEQTKLPCSRLSLSATKFLDIDNSTRDLSKWLQKMPAVPSDAFSDPLDEPILSILPDETSSVATPVATGSLDSPDDYHKEFQIKCDQCGELIDADDNSQREHADFHIAQSLYKSSHTRREPSTASMSGSVSKKIQPDKKSASRTQRRKPGAANTEKFTKLTNFFKPHCTE